VPEVSIYAEYSARAVIATHVSVPDVIPANKIKALAGHDKTASVFVWLGKHPTDKKCPCYVCEHTTKDHDPFKRASWMSSNPIKPFVRFDVGARNVRFKVRGGEHFIVVAECDVDDWLMRLPLNAGERLGNSRLGLALVLPLTIERAKSRKEVEAA
jgi:hypothetical protein